MTFLEYWKRKNASLAHHWDCLDFEEEEVGLEDCDFVQLAQLHGVCVRACVRACVCVCVM